MRPTALITRPVAAVRRLAARTSLQVKLIVAVVALVAVTLAVISVVGIAVLRGSLVGRLDDQLATVAAANLRGLAVGRPLAPPPQGQGVARGDVRLPSAFLVQVRDADGKPLRDYSVPLRENQPLPKLPDDTAYLDAHAGAPFTVDATSGGGRWRVLIEPISDGSDRTLVVAGALDEIDSTIGRLRAIDLIVSGGVLLILVGIAVVIVRASLRPLVEIEQTAEAIAGGQLSRRVPDRDPRTEVGRLGGALNSMLAQIEAAFAARAASEAAARSSEERMRRFVADASHELRTPLTTIRGFAELYRQGASDRPAELLHRIEEQAIRMGLLVEDLLLLARLDQQRPLEREPVDLRGVAADAVQDARTVAPDRRIQLVAGDAPTVVLGDQARLRQVVANLLANALTHTPAGTPIAVRVHARPDATPAAVIEVVDHGPGLSQEQAQRVFERFYRADPARSHDGGTGLGLAIVAALVAAHGGTVEVDTLPGRGATFRVVLPMDQGPGDAQGPVSDARVEPYGSGRGAGP